MQILKATLCYSCSPNFRLLFHFWNLLKNIRKLESVQRRATKLISSLYDLSYTERLQRLNLPSLLYRRSRMDLIMTYKIINGLVDVDMNYFLTVNANANHTRCNGLKLYKSRFNSNTRKFSFSQRIIDWNSLPNDVVTAPNVFIFKTKLDVFLLNRRFGLCIVCVMRLVL